MTSVAHVVLSVHQTVRSGHTKRPELLQLDTFILRFSSFLESIKHAKKLESMTYSQEEYKFARGNTDTF